MNEETFCIRRADVADMSAVLAIEHASEGAPQWSEAVWRGLLQRPAGSEPLRQLFVAVERECVAGFLVVMLSGGVAEIESVAVGLESRRRGLGAALCRYAMRWAAERGAAEMELEVRSQAVGARALYAALGFKQQGVRRGYYKGPEDDAVLFSCAL